MESITFIKFSSHVLSANVFAAGSPVTVIVNGEKVNFPDAQPFINSDSRIMVPARYVSEAISEEVK